MNSHIAHQIETYMERIRNKVIEYKVDDTYTTKIYMAGEGPPLVFIPVYENSIYVYALQLKHFEKNYKVIFYSRRESVSKKLDADIFADDLVKILTHLNISKANAVSMGVTCAIPFLAYLKKPELFNSFFTNNAFVYMKMSLMNKILTKVMMPIIPGSILRKAFISQTTKGYLRDYLLSKLHEIDNFKSKFINGMLTLGYTDIRNQLSKIDLPVHVLTTKKDPLIPHKYIEYIYKNITNASFEIMKEITGHYIPLITPDVFNQKLEMFLNKTIQ